MQLIELDRENIKLILSAEERRTLQLRSCSGPDVPEGAGREAILSLLAEIGSPFGRGCALRLYPRTDGGCEIFAALTQLRQADTLCYLPALSDALSLRIALRRGGFAGESEIFLPAFSGSRAQGCYLRIRGDHAPIEGEFGTLLSVRGDEALPWLSEHCTRLPEASLEG